MTRILIAFCILSIPIQLNAQSLSIIDKGETISLSNGIITVAFNKKNADLISIINKNQINLLGKSGRAYLLAPDFNMAPSSFSVLRNTDSLIELSFLHIASNHFTYDLHYILRKGDEGLYCFLEETHLAKDPAGNYGQTRWGLKADESLFDYHLVRDTIQGPMPKMVDLKNEIQDWTFQLADSTYYTKYDYADYIEDRYVHGMAGQKSGLGIFVINPSHEYLNGGPTKQYQNVHSTPFLINMFNCGHFLSDIRKGDNMIQGDWKKLNGPFFIYIADGKNINEVWSKAKVKAMEEQKKWPYTWMEHIDYPKQRGQLVGQILTKGKAPREGTRIVLAAPDFDWQAQSQGYIYATKTKPHGDFSIPNIRQGIYTLYVYGNNRTDEYVKKNIIIKENKKLNVGILNWKPKTNGTLLWQIGIADRKTTGFKLADSKRSYDLFLKPPADLVYTVGVSTDANDWYYAQTKPGSWKIKFNNNKALHDSVTLTLGVAGCARNPQLDILVNGQLVTSLKMGNDASVYRSAIAGGYYQLKKIKFPASLLTIGTNTIDFQMVQAKSGAGVMYDVIKLEGK